MTNYLRDILPREEIRRQDRLPGRYPTVARTGDSRLGTNKIFFDDTETILFRENVVVSYPTTLSETSEHLDSDLGSDIITWGNVTKNGSAQFVELREHVELFKPFTETQVEVNLGDTQFARTGSDITDVGLGFTSEIKSKTIIRIPLEIASALAFPSQSAGHYYYNKDLKRFEPLKYNGVGVANQNPSSRRPFGNTFGGTEKQEPLFNCLGIPQSDIYTGNAGSYSFTVFGASAGPLYDFAGSTLLSSGAYAATSSQFLDIASYLHAPFLLEKAHLELPFQAGPNWFACATTHGFLDGYVSLTADQTSFGGGAATFALLNQIKTTRRDLILSGTIVSNQDCTPWFEHKASAYGFVTARTLNGFTAFATPGFRVPSADFRGNAQLSMNAATSHGTLWERMTSPDPFIPTYYGTAGADAASAAQFGRSMAGSSGRSVFGGEYSLPADESTLRAHSAWNLSSSTDPNLNDYYLVNGNQNKNSPYLITPQDRLVAYFSVPRAPWGTIQYPDGFGGFNYEWAQSGSREDANIDVGTAYLTLYGSFVKNESEFHDTLNQRLETDEIHEIIGNDPVVDQFDVVYTNELSSSYFSRFSISNAVPYVSYGTKPLLSSSINFKFDHFADISANTPWSTEYRWAKTRRIHELQKSMRNTLHICTDEVFSDCRVLDPNELVDLLAPGQQLTINSEAGFIGSYVFTTRMIDWWMTYPNEPKFKNVSKILSKNIKGKRWSGFLSGGGVYSNAYFGWESLNYEHGPYDVSNSWRLVAAECPSGGGTFTGLGLSEFIKFFYGFGDGRNTGDNGFTKFKIKEFGNATQGCDIRGWRYGMTSAFPQRTFAVFKRDHYGYLRDMLEQRLDTKFYIDGDTNGARGQTIPSPVTIKFLSSDGSLTLPEYTHSSNLSTEATSSLPYFDGNVRNRENPISLAKTNQSLVVI